MSGKIIFHVPPKYEVTQFIKGPMGLFGKAASLKRVERLLSRKSTISAEARDSRLALHFSAIFSKKFIENLL